MSNRKTWLQEERSYQRGQSCHKCGSDLSPTKCGNKYCSDNVRYRKPVTRRKKFRLWWWL